MHPRDLQLEQLRTLLVGREIETLSRLTGVVDDPERLRRCDRAHLADRDRPGDER